MDAYKTFGESRFETKPEEVGTAACWEGDDAICVYQAGRETLLIHAPGMDLIATLEGLFPEFIP